METPQSTIVMTGGTSGFGAIAAEQMTTSGKVRLILGARRPTAGGESVPLELTELDSVRAFAALRGAQLTWPEPSELARKEELAQALWNDSARLVGLR